MTGTPWTAEDRQQVVDALAEIYVLADAGDEHNQLAADKILSLLNERGLLKKKDDLCVGKTDRITMDMMSAAFPHLVSQIRAEERERCAKLLEDGFDFVRRMDNTIEIHPYDTEPFGDWIEWCGCGQDDENRNALAIRHLPPEKEDIK